MNPMAHLVHLLQEQNCWQDTIQLSRNELLVMPGSTHTHLYYVVKGSLRVYVVEEYEEHTIRFGYRNNLITALDSFLTGAPTDFYIQALKATELRMIPKSAFMTFVKSDPAYAELWQQLLEAFVFQLMERERDILTTSPYERYQRVLQRSPQLFQEIPPQHIASYLRMTPETLSRIKKS